MASVKITDEMRKNLLDMLFKNTLSILKMGKEMFEILQEIRETIKISEDKDKENLLELAEKYEEKLCFYCLSRETLRWYSQIIDKREETDLDAENILRWYAKVEPVFNKENK
mgnify:CR=1 FL=1